MRPYTPSVLCATLTAYSTTRRNVYTRIRWYYTPLGALTHFIFQVTGKEAPRYRKISVSSSQGPRLRLSRPIEYWERLCIGVRDVISETGIIYRRLRDSISDLEMMKQKFSYVLLYSSLISWICSMLQSAVGINNILQRHYYSPMKT